MLGVRSDRPMTTPPGEWEAFAKASILPDLSAVRSSRAPLRHPNGRCVSIAALAADVTAIGHRVDGVVGPEAEFEFAWMQQLRDFRGRHGQSC